MKTREHILKNIANAKLKLKQNARLDMLPDVSNFDKNKVFQILSYFSQMTFLYQQICNQSVVLNDHEL